jgi:hypothetical protein
VLVRVIYSGETVGSAGASTLSIAQILGASERNNRRDEITSAAIIHSGRVLQAIEGRRVDVDRLMSRIRSDRRITNTKVLVDKPISQRRFDQPMTLCDNPTATLQAVGAADMTAVTAFDAERIVELRQAA